MSDSDVQDAATGDEYDPFADFDASAGVGSVRDPHPVFHELRAKCPVHIGTYHEEMGTEPGLEAALLGDSVPHTVLSFDTVQQALKDGETFSSSGYADSMGLVFGHSILEMDEPEHHLSLIHI